MKHPHYPPDEMTESPAGRNAPDSYTRRDVLIGTGSTIALALAGCTAPAGHGAAEVPSANLRMDAIEEAALPTKVLFSVGVDGPGWRADLMDDILDGETTVTRTRPPLPDGEHVYYDDVVYALDYDVIAQTPATSFQIKIDIVEGSVNESEAIQFSELPRVDRKKFASRGWAEGGTFGLGTSVLYTHTEREKSALVPESDYSYIVWEDGSEARWIVEDAYETTVNTYEYSAEQYLTAAAYGRKMRDRMGFTLSELTDEQQNIVTTAIDERRYTVESDRTPSPPFRKLADRFREQEQAHALDAEAEGDLNGAYIVQYRERIYWTVLTLNTDSKETDTSK